jgi:Diphthamide biosynthesis methyltransferase
LKVVAVNRAQGLHTLVLLDLDPTGEGVGNQRPMQPADIVQSINSMAKKMLVSDREVEDDTTFELMKREACIDLLSCLDSLSLVLCTDMGTNNQRISLHSISTLANAEEGGMHCLVIPAKLGEIESRALARWSKV